MPVIEPVILPNTRGPLSAPAHAHELLDPQQLVKQLDGTHGNNTDPTTPTGQLTRETVLLKQALNQADALLAERFWCGSSVEGLVRSRAWVVEQLLLWTWQRLIPADAGLALVAVGGFGRGELHPHSDVDLMILHQAQSLSPETQRAIEGFFALLWDAGLYPGHSVRSVQHCAEESLKDVKTITNLMEARLLTGSEVLFAEMQQVTGPQSMWPGPAFFNAKLLEQQARHERFHDTAYNLEPNIKEGPGGLRDIQMIGWVTQRHLGADSLHRLVEHGFLTENEYGKLVTGQTFLWRVRFALHLLAGRPEDRLLFDYQRQIALKLSNLKDDHDDASAVVEQFMQQYYRAVMQLERLNESLLQLLREELISDASAPVKPLGRDFNLRNGYLGLRDEQLFARRPQLMMEMFVLLARRPDIRGVRASTIRLVRANLHRIDEDFRQRPDVRTAFLKLLRQSSGVYSQLQRMNRYGVLGAFLPAFAQITGRMQFDLFHVYTVDQHTLFVVRNLRRFAYGKYAENYPYMEALFDEIEKPELLYLAALFHDIAKGRGGDHSELGAVDARVFCQSLGLPAADVALVSWLVEQHLLMSQTAQRKDINDPDVIADFIAKVATESRMRHLYLLTVADISATSPQLWNSWKSGLLQELYRAARVALNSGQKPDRAQHHQRVREKAWRRLIRHGAAESSIEKVWAWLPDNISLRMSPGQLAWATQQLLDLPSAMQVIVAVRRRRKLGISEVLVSAPDYTGLFASTTSVFDQMGLDVLSAKVLTGNDERSFDLFQVMDARGLPLKNEDAETLTHRLTGILGNQQLEAPLERKIPRRLRSFVSAPELRFGLARGGTVTEVELICSDRPGLLSQLAAAMVSCDIRIKDAMIATFGDRVEDMFLVTNAEGGLLDEARQAQLVAVINERLATD